MNELIVEVPEALLLLISKYLPAEAVEDLNTYLYDFQDVVARNAREAERKDADLEIDSAYSDGYEEGYATAQNYAHEMSQEQSSEAYRDGYDEGYEAGYIAGSEDY